MRSILPFSIRGAHLGGLRARYADWLDAAREARGERRYRWAWQCLRHVDTARRELQAESARARERGISVGPAGLP